MSALNLRLEEPGDMPFMDEMFYIAKPAIESGKEDLIRSAAQKIALMLPENDHDLICRSEFDFLCITLAEQIPFDHECMLSVVMLLELVHKSERFTAEKTSYPSPPEDNTQNLRWMYYRVAYDLRERWNSISSRGETVEERAAWAGHHAFAAHLELRGIVYPAYEAVLDLRWVLEGLMYDAGIDERFCEDAALAAAQHIHIAGHTLLRQVLDKSVEPKSWWAGEFFTEFDGDPRSLDRWRFWQNELRKIGEGRYHLPGMQRTSAKNREFIRRVADSMTAIAKEVCSLENPTATEEKVSSVEDPSATKGKASSVEQSTATEEEVGSVEKPTSK